MAMREGRSGVPIRAWLLAAILVVGAYLVLAQPVTVYQCDGAVPRWRIPDDYRGGGCALLRPDWQEVLPWTDAERELVCLGMCMHDTPMWTPDD